MLGELVIERIAQACRRLELDMWDRLGRHADVADLKVAILRELEELENEVTSGRGSRPPREGTQINTAGPSGQYGRGRGK